MWLSQSLFLLNQQLLRWSDQVIQRQYKVLNDNNHVCSYDYAMFSLTGDI